MDPISRQEAQTILVVDDTPDNLTLMGSVLKDSFKVKVANNGERALRIARAIPPPDLILLDIMMPGIDGYEVCQQLKENEQTAAIPIIFLTARMDVEDEERGLALGAVDYITKPISPPIVLARVRAHLKVKVAADFLRDQNAYLEQEVERRTQEVRVIQQVTILAMASLAETRDNETGKHLQRTQRYVKLLAQKLQGHPRFAHYLSDHTINMLFKSAPLHDIGKVGIPDRILLKPGPLDPAEFEIMKTHTTIGRDAIVSAERSLGIDLEFLQIAKEIAYGHQEKWDGTGYPQQLAGDDIPISARLMAVADVYDALSSRRVYREPMPEEKVHRIIIEGRDRHFDPDIVDAYVALQEQFREIASTFLDTDQDEVG